MPIDASIPLQGRGLELQSPLDRFAKLSAIENNQKQNRLADLTYAKTSKDAEDQNKLQQLIAANTNPDGSQNREGIIMGLKELGRGDMIQNTNTEFSNADAAKSDAALKALDNHMKSITYLSQILSGATDENYPQVVQEAERVIPGSSKNFPPAFDKAAIDAVVQQGIPLKEKIEMQKAQIEAQLKAEDQKWDRGYKMQALDESKRRTDVMSSDRKAANAIAREKASKSKVALSATAQKELFEADDTVQSSKAVIGLLDKAITLNDKAYSGYAAGERAKLRSNLPGESDQANATVDLNNIITGQALESLKAIFGGMPTEGERAILMDMQASVDKTPKQRAAIIERAKTAAERRLKFNEEKAKGLRDGSYMTEGAQEADDGDIFSQADAILGGM